MGKSKTCFVIGPVGEPESETRKWADKIFKHIIAPAAKSCGYEDLARADKSSRPGMITVEILQHLFNDDMVIADLTEGNPNVYYELAIRHALPKPFVQVIKRGERLPFDAKDLRTVEVGLDVEEATNAAKLLSKYITDAEKQGDKVVTPITLVSKIEMLQRSGDSQQQILGQLLARMNAMDISMRQIDMRIASALPSLSDPTDAFDRMMRIMEEAKAEKLRPPKWDDNLED